MSFLTSARPLRSATSSLLRQCQFQQQQQLRALSKFTIVGRLAAQPELVTTPNGRELVRYAVGTSMGSGENQKTSWWKVAAFTPEGPGREHLLSLGKGSLVYVEGDASMRKFEREGRQETGLSLVQTKYEVMAKKEAMPNDGEIIEE